jgi:hypothetical protein
VGRERIETYVSLQAELSPRERMKTCLNACASLHYRLEALFGFTLVAQSDITPGVTPSRRRTFPFVCPEDPPRATFEDAR